MLILHRIFIILAILNASAGTASAQIALPTNGTKFTAREFSQIPFMSDPELSPNGKKVAARIGVNGEQILGIIDLDNPSSPVLMPLRDNDLLEWMWVNDDWLAIRLGDDGMISTYPMYITRVITVRADGMEARRPGLQDGGAHSEVIWVAHDGSPRMLIMAQKSVFDSLDFWPAVFEVDASTGRRKQVVDPISGINSWYADSEGVVRFGYGYDNRFEKRRAFFRSSAKERFRILDEAAFARNETLIRPVSLPASGGSNFVFSDHEGFDWLYELDLERMSPGKPAISVPGVDLDAVLLSRDLTRVIGVDVTTNRWRRIWTDAKFAAAQAAVEKTLPKGLWATVVTHSRDETRLIYHIGNASVAGSYHLYDFKTGLLQRLAFVNDHFKDTSFSQVSTIRYKARDGLEIPAVLTLPNGKIAKNLPLVLLPHGGPNARDEERWDYWAQFIAHLGYAVVQPNYRGSTGFGNAFSNAGDGQWGLKMQDDLNDAVDFLAQKGTIDPKRVCILGGSYGGYAAMRAATRDGERFRCSVSVNGVADLVKLNQYDRSFLFSGKRSTAWIKKRAYDLVAVSPIHDAARAASPMLIIHGKMDSRVPVDQSRDFAKALEKAGKPVRYVELPKADHGLTRYEDRVAFLTEVEAFLAKYNPAN